MRSTKAAHELRIDAVSKHYGHVVAVHETSFVVPGGEFLTLLGPSGSGKSTLLMMVAGFEQPSSGDILVDGRSIVDLPPERRNFGMVFQGYALFPHMTVAQNIHFPLKVRGIGGSAAVDRVRRAMEMVRLDALADRLPKQLSGGQQQRVALARALVFEPDIVLLDEPLGALDRKLRAEVQIELRALHERLGATFLFVTHDQEEALSMSGRIAIMCDGRLVQIGRPDELYERPVNRFSATFLGDSNFIEGWVVERDGDALVYQAGDRRFRQIASAGNAGDRILLALRPEKIRLSDKDPVDKPNRVAAVLEHVNYFGSYFHIALRTSEFGTVLVTAPAWQSPVAPEPGRQLHIAWDEDAAHPVFG
jgi:putative spermidine/putrescine transport system ATP-binding protein/mannopine transport system ATP-binding protein